MDFPIEVLDEIVSHSLISCETLRSWLKLSSHTKDLVKKEAGIVFVKDGLNIGRDDFILDFEDDLMDSLDILNLISDTFNVMDLNEFIAKKKTLLIIVHSTRNYSDPLTSVLGYIAANCHFGTKISTLYHTSVNFVSRLYFREFLHYQKRLRLCELYIIGNPHMKHEQMVDVYCIFEKTYLKNISKIYSLDLNNEDNYLYSDSLIEIKEINVMVSNKDLFDLLVGCPKLKVIELCNFPIRFSGKIYRLPLCDSIAIGLLSSQSGSIAIDGENVRKKLILHPALRTSDLNVNRLNFPNISKLELIFKDTSIHDVTFTDCCFSNLTEFSCGSSIVPWRSIPFSNNCVKSLTLTLYNEKQLNWFLSSPYKIENLKLTASSNRFPFQSIDYTGAKYKTAGNLIVDLKSFWQCYLLNSIIDRYCSIEESLTIRISSSLLDCFTRLDPTKLIQPKVDRMRGNPIIHVPKVPVLSIFNSENANSLKRKLSVSSDGTEVGESPLKFGNVFNGVYNSEVFLYRDMMISPFARRDSEETVVNPSSSRPSIISNTSRSFLPAKRSNCIDDRYSHKFHLNPENESEFEPSEPKIIFDFTNHVPNRVITNISTLCNSKLFSNSNFVIPLLVIEIEDIDIKAADMSLNEFNQMLYGKIQEIKTYLNSNFELNSQAHQLEIIGRLSVEWCEPTILKKIVSILQQKVLSNDDELKIVSGLDSITEKQYVRLLNC